MNKGVQRLTCAQISAWDMVDYLCGLGFNLTKIKGKDYWYLSPFRNERTASFKINIKLNRWFDHGIGKGGNVIDFAVMYHNCTVAELLRKINSNFSFHQPSFYLPQSFQEGNRIKVLNDFAIS